MTERRRLKILHVLSQRPDSTGSGIYVQAMLREAESKGHRNFLVAGIQSDRPPQLPCIDADHCRMVTFGEGDLPFAIAGMSDVMPYTSTRFCDLSADAIDAYKAAFTRHLREVVNTFQPDLIHSHHLWMVTALTRQLFPHIPLLTTCHGSDLRQFQNCADLRFHVISGCRGIDAVMALSHAQKQSIINLYDIAQETVHVVGAGYNAERFTQTVKPLPEPVQLVYAGKLSNAKGVPWLLQALSGIDTPDWHLHLVGGGSGEEKERCLSLARQLGNRLTVYGAVPQQQLAEIMGKAHIFVLPSLFEGLPLVVLEALASGCRVIATALPGVTEILGERKTDFIDLVPTPRLQEVDKPVAADQKQFTQNLGSALQRQLWAARKHPQIDLSPIADRMAAFSWSGVFRKVEALYLTHATLRGSKQEA